MLDLPSTKYHIPRTWLANRLKVKITCSTHRILRKCTRISNGQPHNFRQSEFVDHTQHQQALEVKQFVTLLEQNVLRGGKCKCVTGSFARIENLMFVMSVCM